jgi:hypothetical protein
VTRLVPRRWPPGSGPACSRPASTSRHRAPDSHLVAALATQLVRPVRSPFPNRLHRV